VFYVLSGLQRLDLQHKLSIFASIIEFVVSLALLSMEYGLLALAYGHCAGQVLSTLLAWVLCKRLRPALRISPFCVSRESFRMVFSLGMRFQLLSALAILFVQGTKVVISNRCGISLVGIYELAEKLLSLSRALSGALIDPLMPAFANLHAGADRERSRLLFVHSSKLVAMTGMAALAGLFVFADPVILAWTGRSEPVAAWTIRVMAFGHFVWVMTGPGSSVLRGSGSLRLELTNALLRTLLIIVLILPGVLSQRYDLIVLAVVASRIVSSVWFLVRFTRQSEQGFGWYFGGILGRATLIGVAACLVGLAARWIPTGWIPVTTERWRAGIEVVSVGSSFGLLSMALLWYALFTRVERQYLLRRLLPRRKREAPLTP
jgi:O-antigen/teichoic acid export membrane protein